jgi:hypothetical protein
MQVTKHRHFDYLTPMDEAKDDVEMATIFRLKWPKAVSGLSTEANFFAEMVDECLQYEAWRVIGFDSFAAFCREKLDMTVKEVRGILEQVASDGGHDATQELSRAEETQRKREAAHNLKAEHPEWTQQQIADEMGCSERWVRELTGSENGNLPISVPPTIKQEAASTGKSERYIQDKRRLAAGVVTGHRQISRIDDQRFDFIRDQKTLERLAMISPGELRQVGRPDDVQVR